MLKMRVRAYALYGVICVKAFAKRHAAARGIPALMWVDSAAGMPRATMDGRSRVLIENHTGIIEFSFEKLRLDSRLGEIVVTGSGLSLSQVRSASLIVQGRIDGVSMPEGGGCDG